MPIEKITRWTVRNDDDCEVVTIDAVLPSFCDGPAIELHFGNAEIRIPDVNYADFLDALAQAFEAIEKAKTGK